MTAKEKLKSIWIESFKNEEWFNPEKVNDADLLEFLTESNTVLEETTSGSRWWNNLRVVAEVNGTYFKYAWAETTGDMGAQEAGWEFDWNSLKEVEPYTETITVTKYRRI